MLDWPHAPIHRISASGAYMVTAGTFRKQPLLDNAGKKNLAQDVLFSVMTEYGWELQAWTILSNHYHFIAIAPEDAAGLRRLISKLHTLTAARLNKMDRAPERRVWFQFWDSRITHQRSYLARLHYVHENAVHHGLVPVATQYPWCSAAWFERTATPAFQKTVRSFKTERLKVPDDF